MSDRTDSLSRRGYLRGLVAVGGAAALAACQDATGGTDVPTGTPSERPARQHAWNDALDTDQDGNIRLSRHHVLVPLSRTRTPDKEAREQVESAFQSLESAYAHDTSGLLFTVGYTPEYFRGIGEEPPIPEPEPLTSMESPEFDEFDALVTLSSDNPDVVLEAEQALLGKRAKANGVEMETTLEGVFEQASPRRTGFVGAGLPAEYTDTDGVPDSVPEEAPFFMGFRSGFSASQASEDRVTIEEGPYAGGTTTHVESLELQLRTWFEQDSQYQRVAKMFSREHAESGMVGNVGEKLETSTGVAGEIADRTEQDAREHGIVGHAQKAARARDPDGTPPLLRRDFNTVDGDRPGVHFVAHQQRIEEFVRTRKAVAGEDIAGQGVGRRLNNGILQYIFVRRRGNFLVPPREKRSLPGI